MKKILVLVAMFSVFSVGFSEAFVGKIDFKRNKQIITDKLKNGKLRGLVTEEGISYKKVKSIIFHSVDTGDFSGKIANKNYRLVKFKIIGTAIKGGGWWELVLKSGEKYSFNPDKFKKTKPWVKIDDVIYYGGYEKPELRIEAPGMITINFHTNAIPGFVSMINKKDIEYFLFKSVSLDWNEEIFTGTVEKNNLGEYFSQMTSDGIELPAPSMGTVVAKMKDGSEVYILLSEEVWKVESNVAIVDTETGLILEYILAP